MMDTTQSKTPNRGAADRSTAQQGAPHTCCGGPAPSRTSACCSMSVLGSRPSRRSAICQRRVIQTSALSDGPSLRETGRASTMLNALDVDTTREYSRPVARNSSLYSATVRWRASPK